MTNSKFSYYYSLNIGLFAILMLLFPKMIGISVSIFIILIGIGIVKKNVTFKLNTVSILFMAFYLCYIFYMIFTRNPDQSIKYAASKLLFFLFPLILAFRPKEKVNYIISIYSYLFALLLLIVIGLTGSIYHLLHHVKSYHSFISSNLSTIHHPTYTTVFILLGICFLVIGLNQKLQGFKKKWIVPVLFFLIIYSIFLISLAGILFLFVLLTVFLLVLIYKRFGKTKAFVSVVLAPFLVYLSILAIPLLEGEWSGAKFYLSEYFKNQDQFVENQIFPMSGSETRLVMWTITSKLCAKYPFGVGTGNLDEVLGGTLRKHGQIEMAKENYNPHNQFLQTMLEIGIVGLLILLSIIGFSIHHAFKYKNWLLLIFASCLAFNCLFESMLQQQSGITIFTFILVAMTNVSKIESNKPNSLTLTDR